MSKPTTLWYSVMAAQANISLEFQIVISDSFCQCNCCQGGEIDSWCFLLTIFPLEGTFQQIRKISACLQQKPCYLGHAFVSFLILCSLHLSLTLSYLTTPKLQTTATKQMILITRHANKFYWFSPSIHSKINICCISRFFSSAQIIFIHYKSDNFHWRFWK